MSTDQQSRGDAHLGARMRNRLGETGWTRTRAVLSLGMVLGLGAVGTMAAWSDSATATTGMFSTAAIQMKIDGQRPTASFTQLTESSMMRGQSTAGELSVENTGTIDFQWAVSASSTGSTALLDKLKVSLHETAANDGSTCGGPIIGQQHVLSSNPNLASGRDLTAGTSVPVCIQVTVDANAGKDVRFKIADIGFNFTAEA